MTTADQSSPVKPLRIDAHHHVWDLDVRDQPWTVAFPAIHRSFLLSDLHPHLLSNRIDGTVVVQTLGLAEETRDLLALPARRRR
jgi:L-fuconolactonase